MILLTDPHSKGFRSRPPVLPPPPQRRVLRLPRVHVRSCPRPGLPAGRRAWGLGLWVRALEFRRRSSQGPRGLRVKGLGFRVLGLRAQRSTGGYGLGPKVVSKGCWVWGMCDKVSDTRTKLCALFWKNLEAHWFRCFVFSVSKQLKIAKTVSFQMLPKNENSAK